MLGIHGFPLNTFDVAIIEQVVVALVLATVGFNFFLGDARIVDCRSIVDKPAPAAVKVVGRAAAV